MIRTLDNTTNKQFGENGHIEYSWSNNIREQILQFSFQITRADEVTVNKLHIKLKDILLSIQKRKDVSLNKEEGNHYLSLLYRMIGNTRDIIDGKGEYLLTYMMIYSWYEFYPELAYFALSCLVDLNDETVHPYGSWKDMKYFCEYCKEQGMDINHPLIQYSINMINDKLKTDSMIYTENLENDSTNTTNKTNPNNPMKNISLVSKWIPREKSSFGWLYEELSCNYYPEYLLTAKSPLSRQKAIKKCKSEYRKLNSKLNIYLDTVQIKQCGKNWNHINFNNVTSITLSKQKQAFLNIKSSGEVRYTDEDRIECANHFKEHIKKALTGEVEMKGKRVGMQDFTKQALALIELDKRQKRILYPDTGTHSHNDNNDNDNDLQCQIDLLNSQWRNNGTQTNALGNFIAMVDVSGSMEGDPKHVSTALGIRIAEKSKLGKRVMTFSSHPSWVNLEKQDDFVSMVKAVCTDSGLNTNFYAAMNLILDAIIESKLSHEEVEDMVLVILSDMQIDHADKNANETMYQQIEEKYEAAGIRLYGKPFKTPHILMWNLRSTDGFPCLSSQKNTSMMSGFSPSLLNLFCDKGISGLQSCTPWAMLEQNLEKERYKIMGDKCVNFLI